MKRFATSLNNICDSNFEILRGVKMKIIVKHGLNSVYVSLAALLNVYKYVFFSLGKGSDDFLWNPS